ncbi:helix-turn-helix domain-containing protein [Plantactinospora soyae]|uniref:Transcriptional regulator with XRE-family HTH domain n=1 Tax=Plantactinospora soyae TaxID=1544732 RepID=A0A927M8X8_9ACTN|nr:helix-turn-helix transcriptional regulator [Plantactinospora soyae]MBE1490177.1 transcriptional regulator with XRE-family HTH domain [Plantactinospora soyae]
MGISPSEYLLRELRRRRKAAGVSQEVLGGKCFCSDSQVSAIETGSTPVTLKHLRLVDKALETGGYFETLWNELVKDDAAPVWLREWLEYEREARTFRWYEPAFVPGLFQTEAYARALFSLGRLSTAAIEQKVTSRMERQAVLDRDEPPQFFVVVDEMVIRRLCGSREVVVAQLEHLMDLAERPNINLHVIPTTLGLYSGLAGAFIIADLPDHNRVGYVDNQLAAQVVTRGEDVANLGLSWDAVHGEALPRVSSLDLLKEVTKSWT